MKLNQFLEAPGNLQCYACGAKLLQLAAGLDGSQTVRLDHVNRLKKLTDLTVEFIQSLDAALNDTEELPDEQNSCDCAEKLTNRRCPCEKNHAGKHRHTGKSSLSLTTVRELVKTLTGDDIKQLAGLDDTKVMKGRENFQTPIITNG